MDEGKKDARRDPGTTGDVAAGASSLPKDEPGLPSADLGSDEDQQEALLDEGLHAPGIIPEQGHVMAETAMSKHERMVLEDLKQAVGPEGLEGSAASAGAESASSATAAASALPAARKPKKSGWWFSAILAVGLALFLFRNGVPEGWRVILVAIPIYMAYDAVMGYKKDQRAKANAAAQAAGDQAGGGKA